MQLIENDAENVTKCILMTILLFHTVIICLNLVNIHEYWLNIVYDNSIYHLYYTLIPFDMYVTQNINNCKNSIKRQVFPKAENVHIKHADIL